MGTSLIKFNRESNPAKRISNKEEEIISNKFDVVGHLPSELAQKIFLQLSPDDLRSAALCCLSWKAALSSEYLWKILCRRDGCLEVEESNRSEFYTNFMKRYSYWQGVYWYNQTLQRNWETNNYREAIYELDEVYFFSCMMERCLYDDAFVCTNKNWKNLYVYNLNNKEFKPKVFSMPERSSGCITPYIWKSGKYLIYLRIGAGLTVWDLETGSIVLDEPWNHVDNVHVYKNLFVLETRDDKFEVFNIDTGRIEYESNGISKNVDIIDGRIVYTTEHYVIHILNWEDKSFETFTCCNEIYHTTILIKNDLLLSFGEIMRDTFGSTLCIWNITSKTKLHSIFLGRSVDYFNARFVNKYLILIKNDHLNDYPTFQLWDYMKGTREVTITSKKKIDSCFRRNNISNDYVMVVPRSFKTSIWCLKTKSFVWDLNLHSWRYKLYDLEITKTKLAYAIGHRSKMGGKSVFLHIRDFEI